MTSELDKFFGPAAEVEMPPIKCSHFGRFPDVQELCDTFLEEMEWNTDNYTKQQIVAGARDFNLAIGNNPGLLLRTIQQMKRDKLSIASPRSCITIAREKMHVPDPDSQDGRRKYLRGVEDD